MNEKLKEFLCVVGAVIFGILLWTAFTGFLIGVVISNPHTRGLQCDYHNRWGRWMPVTRLTCEATVKFVRYMGEEE